MTDAAAAASANGRHGVPWPARVVAVVVAALVLAGCAGASGGGVSRTSTPSTPRPDEGMRNTIKAALTRAGRTREADVVTRGGSRLTPVAAPFLKSWRIVQVDFRQGAHPVMFHVAVGGGQARLLTGTPSAWNGVMAADGAQVADPAVAARLGRVFLETTRRADKLTYVVGGVDEIRFRPKITGGAAQRRDEIVAEYRPVIKPPAATATGGGFTVVAFVVMDRELQRHDLTVTAKGAVQDKTTILVPDLPTPLVR